MGRGGAFAVLLALFLVSRATTGLAQEGSAGDESGRGMLSTLPRLNSPLEDRLRLRQLTGAAETDGFLLRSPSTLLPAMPGEGTRWQILLPDLDAVWNSALPFSLNHGSLWAGRGLNLVVTGGARITTGNFELVLAPQLTYSQNLDFQILPPRDTARSEFASPWHIRTASADLPIRFGDAPLVALHPGQSSLSLRTDGLRLGFTTENEWWGPGLRNAIVMSSHAAGVPRAFVGTDAPLVTGIGSFETRWIVGALSESLHFDLDEENDLRSLSGFVATYRPRWEPDLTVGISRVVYGAVSGPGSVPERAFDVFTWWKRQPVAPDSTIADEAALKRLRGRLPDYHDREQLTSLFGRWIFPDDGLEVYLEWARVALPSSLRDLLVEPHHSQGYTVGVQWAGDMLGTDVLRLQAEATYLEESSSFNNRPVPSFYVSQPVPQGYTQRGRTIGAAIGPGASSQWIATDWLAGEWGVGLFVGRIRWENDVYYRGINRVEGAHDVSLFGGVRASARVPGASIDAEFTQANRYNYLFQNPSIEPEGRHAVDRWNSTLRLTITPEL